MDSCSRALRWLLLAGLAGCAATAPLPGPHAACRDLLLAQQAAWNRADLSAFAAGYQRSPELVFAGPDGVQLGFDAMLARYRRRYPDAAAMGQLGFDDLRFADLGPDSVLASGAWRLQRAADAPGGRFALVLRRFEPGWRIVLDYTVQTSPAPGATAAPEGGP